VGRKQRADIADVDDADNYSDTETEVAVAAEDVAEKRDRVRFNIDNESNQNDIDESGVCFSPLVFDSDDDTEEEEEDEFWENTVVRRRMSTMDGVDIISIPEKPKPKPKRDSEAAMRKEIENDFFKPIGHTFPLDFFMDQEEIALWASRITNRDSILQSEEGTCYGIVPCKKTAASNPEGGGLHPHHPTQVWTPCRLVNYNATTNQFLVKWIHPTSSASTPTPKYQPKTSSISRINLRFSNEPKSLHLFALHKAKDLRMDFEQKLVAIEIAGMLKPFMIKTLPNFPSEKVMGIWDKVLRTWRLNLELRGAFHEGFENMEIEATGYETLQEVLSDYQLSLTKAALLFAEQLQRLRPKEWEIAFGISHQNDDKSLLEWKDSGYGGQDGGQRNGWWWNIHVEVGFVANVVKILGDRLSTLRSKAVVDGLWAVMDKSRKVIIGYHENPTINSEDVTSEWEFLLGRIIEGKIRIPVALAKEALMDEAEKMVAQAASIYCKPKQRKHRGSTIYQDYVYQLNPEHRHHQQHQQHQHRNQYQHQKNSLQSTFDQKETSVDAPPTPSTPPVAPTFVNPQKFQSEYAGFEPNSLRKPKISMTLDEVVSVCLFVLDQTKVGIKDELPQLAQKILETIPLSTDYHVADDCLTAAPDGKNPTSTILMDPSVLRRLMENMSISIIRPLFHEKAMNIIRLLRDGHIHIRVGMELSESISTAEEAKIIATPSLVDIQKHLDRLFKRWMQPIPIRLFDAPRSDHPPTVQITLETDDAVKRDKPSSNTKTPSIIDRRFSEKQATHAPEADDEPVVDSTMPEAFRALTSLFQENTKDAIEAVQGFINDREKVLSSCLKDQQESVEWQDTFQRLSRIQILQHHLSSGLIFVSNETRGNMFMMDVTQIKDDLEKWVSELEHQWTVEIKDRVRGSVSNLLEHVIRKDRNECLASESSDVQGWVSDVKRGVALLEQHCIFWEDHEVLDVITVMGWIRHHYVQ
jgi:hypothetical protein